ncbi:hypothetical protein [Burkholderia metallica]|uniref:hypothetical protein n=1 Tax=Burkholderia metallica TaxID=488729 RepID=UPI001576DA22|nr:hypothetical protein [Burkholderia metallica]NTZ07762.1 hypothetical protein [Burkholderia metallica]
MLRINAKIDTTPPDEASSQRETPGSSGRREHSPTATIPAALGPLSDRPRPRVRPDHRLSDGESDSENPDVLYRSLRSNESDVRTTGLLPPEGHDASISALAHVQAGSRAEVKSDWVSATRSKKVAAAWAGKSNGQVARFTKPADRETYDLTVPHDQARIFPNGGSGLNAAKGSQEVLIKGGVPAENVTALWNASKVSVRDYHEASSSNTPGFVGKIRSRAKANDTPTPVVLTDATKTKAARGASPDDEESTKRRRD